MKKTLTLPLFLIVLIVSACGPQTTPTPIEAEATQIPATQSPATEQPADLKTYSNSELGLGFQFPSSWFGPEEYVADQTLRVEVGSDKVYPYGTSPEERIYELKNSYYVVIQYSKNDQNTYWREIHQSLLNMADGESLSDTRGLTIRIRQLNLGRFSGFEYISTLSETAQTSAFYSRSVILFDDQSNVLTVMGQPNNVEVVDGNWRDAYQAVDEANLKIFRQIVESITVE
jgi:hypothetical protein